MWIIEFVIRKETEVEALRREEEADGRDEEGERLSNAAVNILGTSSRLFFYFTPLFNSLRFCEMTLIFIVLFINFSEEGSC